MGNRPSVMLLIDTGRRGPRRGKTKAGFLLSVQLSAGPAEKWNFKEYEDATEHESLMRILLEALECLRVPCILTIHTESDYLHSVLTDWIRKWQQDGWRNKRGIPVAEEWQKVKERLDKHTYTVALRERTEYTEWLHGEVSRQ